VYDSLSALSFTLPAYDDAITRVYDQIFTALHMRDNLLRLFPPRIMQHQGKTRQVSDPQILDTSMRLHRATIDLQPAMFLRSDAAQFREFVVDLVMDLQNQQKAHVLEVMSQTSHATGKYIDGKDQNIWDMYIEGLEKVDFAFDHDGKPLVKVYLPSELATKMTTVLPTEEQLKRVSEILNKKRERFLGNKRYRRLHLSVAES